MEKVSLRARPLFEGFSNSTLAQPIRIEVGNTGDSTGGVLTVRNGNQDIKIPIELPRGTTKAVTAYPVGQSFLGLEVVLDTLSGRKIAQVESNMSWSDGSHTPGAVMITTSPGALAFFRTKSEDRDDRMPRRSTVRDGYCTPELAPDRAIGYSDVDIVVLGEGSERLSDQAVRALQRWVMLGGKLIIPGGASTPILADDRWVPVLPMTNARTRSVADLPHLRSEVSVKEPTGTVAVTTGELAPPGEAMRDTSGIWKATRQVGLGKVIQWSFNPFEKPLSSEKYAEVLLKAEIETGDTRKNLSWLVGETQDMSDPMTSSFEVSSEPNPFETKIPAAEKIFGTLLIYFIIVIPLNFWILGRLGRSELAWFTTPLLSIGFAAVFFSYAGSLYTTEQAVSYRGVLVASESQPDSMFVGGTQLFFPRGGAYDLRMTGVESAYPRLGQYQRYVGASELVRKDPLSLVDIGEIKGAVDASNLTFEEFDFWQACPAIGMGAKVAWGDRTKSTLKGELANRSQYPMKNVIVMYRGQAYSVEGVLEAGETKTFSARRARSGGPATVTGLQSLAGILGVNTPVIFADLAGFRPGPQVGKESKSTRSVQIAYVLDRTTVKGP
ncbi:MAG: hypothetical protein HONBIEJF_01672 [Fimbriimonadaceae bacterium]|nr:hypothetical protein [Fimbriimonadaceae bacterium]